MDASTERRQVWSTAPGTEARGNSIGTTLKDTLSSKLQASSRYGLGRVARA